MPSNVLPLLHNLLDEALFSVEDNLGRRTKVTLPGLLARLSLGMPTALTAVQAHQQHPVHAFLVQLGVIALARNDLVRIANDEAEWRALLVQAAKKDGAELEAFTLVVGDLSKPAFLQPPVPERTLENLKHTHDFPSGELDVLITAKNHDVKVNRIARPDAEHWVLALLTLQTMQGVLGAGNYGIARMNSGYGSRPCVAFASDHHASTRFVRDVAAALDARAGLIQNHGFLKHGLGLVWCAPWNGATSLSFADLDPTFIEICRRLRLTAQADGTLVAHRGSSKVARIAAKDARGNTGDVWTPVKRSKDGEAFSMSEAGFKYDYVQDLMFGEWNPGAAGEPRAEPADCLWVGQVLARGQGKTQGYHERWVSVPSKARRLFLQVDDRAKLAQLGKRSKAWVERASTARRNVLKPALLTALQGAPEKLKFDDDRIESYLMRLDSALDDEFFRLLFSHVDDPPEVADEAFERRLVELARTQLESALSSMPIPSARRWRAEAQAARVFFGSARKHFKLAFSPAVAAAAEAGPTSGESL